MTEQEEKNLLLKDLCARLPYGVKCKIEKDWFYDEIKPYDSIFNPIILERLLSQKDTDYCVKPYLRPMSSMTEEEEEELECKFPHLSLNGDDIYGYLARGEIGDFLEFIYSHHIDLNGLIPMGLALEVPEGMYKF